MQIVDSTPFGVRSAFIRLKAREGGADVLLFPMIHIAEASFYSEVSKRLAACDLILHEGVDSKVASHITRSYRWAAPSRRLGLVLQSTMDLEHLRDRLVRADVEAKSFEKRWTELARWVRMLVYALAPYLGLHHRWFTSRAKLARFLTVDVYEKSGRRKDRSSLGKLTEVLIDWRDRHLVSVLDAKLETMHGSDKCIGVVYGASHMSAVILHLVRVRGYRVTSSEWVTVFENYPVSAGVPKSA